MDIVQLWSLSLPVKWIGGYALAAAPTHAEAIEICHTALSNKTFEPFSIFEVTAEPVPGAVAPQGTVFVVWDGEY